MAPRKPHNNRLSSSSALKTNEIWSKTIGYDPYAAAEDAENERRAKAEAEQRAVDNAVKLNDSKTGDPSMMDMMNQFSGYNSPSPLEV